LSQVEELLPAAAGLVVVQEFLSDASLLERWRLLRTDFPLTRLAVVCHAGPRNMDALAGVDYKRFLGIHQIETDLARVVRQFAAASVPGRSGEVLNGYCAFAESRKAVSLIFEGDTFPRTAAELAAAAGCRLKHLRTCMKEDLGQTPHDLLRWNILIRATALWTHGMREPELSFGLGVANTTLARDAHALVGLTFGEAAQLGAQVIATRLIGAVRQHKTVGWAGRGE
jgi:hypothetical protein